MVMNVEKLFQYIEDEVILEFNSDEECMNYFNTYDSQNFKTIKEMKNIRANMVLTSDTEDTISTMILR